MTINMMSGNLIFLTTKSFCNVTEEWWRSFMVYEGEQGRAYASHVFNHVSKI
jgi:hypothetical protein